MNASSRIENATLAAERIQRGRIVLDVARADLDASETVLGSAHPTTWHFREALTAAQIAWDRLRAEFGGVAIEAILLGPSVAVVPAKKGHYPCPALRWISIQGRTFAAQSMGGCRPAPARWWLARLQPPLEYGPYYVCQLADGSTQCDCAEWIYRDEAPGRPPCKHIAALRELGWVAPDLTI